MAKDIIPMDKWNAMTERERLTGLLGMTLDNCYDVLAAPINSRDGVMMNMKTNVIRAVLHTCMKLGMKDRDLSMQRDKLLADLTVKMRNGTDRDPLDEPVE